MLATCMIRNVMDFVIKSRKSSIKSTTVLDAKWSYTESLQKKQKCDILTNSVRVEKNSNYL